MVRNCLLRLTIVCLALAWAYTFWRVPEEARLAPARVVAGHH